MNPGIVFLAALVLFIGVIILLCVVEIHKIDARIIKEARAEKSRRTFSDVAKVQIRILDLDAFKELIGIVKCIIKDERVPYRYKADVDTWLDCWFDEWSDGGGL